MKALILIITSLLTQFATAGDASFYESLGFSQDGKYYAFIQDGVYDGIGAYWIELGIINVASNKYVGRATAGGDEDNNGDVTDPEDRPALLAQLKTQLSFKKYGFSKQAHEEVLISRPPTDHSIYTNSIFSLDYWAQGGAVISVPTYTLLLNQVSAPINDDNQWCHDWTGNYMIELRLRNDDLSSNGSEVISDLQIDKKQPKVRNCSYDYSIKYVTHHKDSISVVLSFRSPGFEGPNERYMVVTGKF